MSRVHRIGGTSYCLLEDLEELQHWLSLAMAEAAESWARTLRQAAKTLRKGAERWNTRSV